jgi:hypothetical protein
VAAGPPARGASATAAAVVVGGEESSGGAVTERKRSGAGGRWFIRGKSYEGFMWKLLVDYASVSSGGKLVGSTGGISNAGDVLVADESRYALSACDLPNKKFIIKLAETIYVDKIGLVSSEFYAATYRHIQVLGSFKWPTNEWRVLGEIETNPLATAEFFDLSESSKCPKCFVRFIKLRILSHHTIEGFSRCALTRVQVFGSTLLESIDRLSAAQHADNSTTTPAAESLRSAIDTVDRRLKGDFLSQPSRDDDLSNGGHNSHSATNGSTGSVDSDSPLLKFIEDMTELQRNYAKVSSSVSTLVAALQQAQTEISTLKQSTIISNTTVGAHGGNATDHSNVFPPNSREGGQSDSLMDWTSNTHSVVLAVVAFTQVLLFMKFSTSSASSPSELSAGRSPSIARLSDGYSSPRLFFARSRTSTVSRLVAKRKTADKHRSLFKGMAAFKAARHRHIFPPPSSPAAPRPRAVSLD